MNKIQNILKKQIEIIKPDKDTLENIEKTACDFCKNLQEKLRKKKIKAEVFIGGSLAKNTLVKKDKYDVDIFVRFSGNYKDNEISKILGGVLGKKAKKVHGSRDYYQIILNSFILEIVPVLKIKKPPEAQNIMDLSYFHVNYLLKKIRENPRLSDEILLAKTFTYAQNCYGAESYIHGFSGYSLELLISYYGSFLNFVKAISKSGDDKIIIDDFNFYENKAEVLNLLNKSKRQGPIILIDPTFKERNALAGLSLETFSKFKKICLNFLKKPDSSFFEKKNIGAEMKKKYGKKLIVVSVKTNKQTGDIAGTKSKKFFDFFVYNLKREFEIKKQKFDYNEKKNIAYFYFVLDKKKDEVVKGPHITKVENLAGFKKKHKNAFIKKHIAYAKVKHNLIFKDFFNMFKKKYKKVIKEMCVVSVVVV